jgi:3-hydroxyacyl-CoA dehydrogenase/enoyl-CoA hydratase/3-hydroxybutyryl-CoA epimerase
MIRTLFYGINQCNKGIERPKIVPAREIRKVGILGAGMMGSSIAYVTAKADIPVVLKDVSMEVAEKGKSYSTRLLVKAVERGRTSFEEKERILSLIETTDDPGKMKDCDLVIEAVIEDRKLKAKVTKESEDVMPSDAIFASNTSTLPITGLATESQRPNQFIGLHFFSPVDKMPLLEIIMGENSGDEALALCLDYAKKIKKTPIVVNDGRGFYTSRVFTTYISEGIACLNEGINPALIEHAGKAGGMPVGPLAVADEVSLDLIYHILKQTVDDLGEGAVESNTYLTSNLFVNKLKRLGRKSGGGFYEYPDQGRKYLWPGLKEHFSLKDEQPSLDEIKKRLLTIQAIETFRCLNEKVLRSVRDADVGSILGWGFPAYTGGTLSYIDLIGIDRFIEDCEFFEQKHGERFKVSNALKEMAKDQDAGFCQ